MQKSHCDPHASVLVSANPEGPKRTLCKEILVMEGLQAGPLPWEG